MLEPPLPKDHAALTDPMGNAAQPIPLFFGEDKIGKPAAGEMAGAVKFGSAVAVPK